MPWLKRRNNLQSTLAGLVTQIEISYYLLCICPDFSGAEISLFPIGLFVTEAAIIVISTVRQYLNARGQLTRIANISWYWY